MPTTSKPSVQPTRKGSTTLQSPKPPARQFDSNRPHDSYRGAIHKREEASPAGLVRES